MFNKQLYLFAVTGLLMVGGLFSSTRILAASSSEHESVPLTQYWNIIADHLGQSLSSRARLGLNTVYVDKKHTALDAAQYLEKQLSISLRRSGFKLVSPTSARYVIELDVEINKRLNGHGTLFVEGGDIDQLWMIQALNPTYPGQYAHYELLPLAMNQPVGANLLSGTDTEIIITARVMERGWIRISQNYAFYITAENTVPDNEPEHKRVVKVEDSYGGDEFSTLQNHQRAFLNYQEKLDAHIQQLIDSYQF